MRIALASAALAWAAPAPGEPGPRWAREIAEASSRFSLPEAWIRRVIAAESGGRTELAGKPIVSSAGAMGLMQLMPGTWREMRSLLGLGSNPHDPADNILAGTAYLRSLYDRFGYPGLFAAYNAGPGRYSDFLSGRRALPLETRSYLAALTRRPAATAPGAEHRALFAVGPGESRSGKPVPGAGSPPSPALFVQLRGMQPR